MGIRRHVQQSNHIVGGRGRANFSRQLGPAAFALAFTSAVCTGHGASARICSRLQPRCRRRRWRRRWGLTLGQRDGEIDGLSAFSTVVASRIAFLLFKGAPSGFRTPDPLIKSQLLYQLS